MEGWQGRVFWRLSAASLSLMLMLRLAEKNSKPDRGSQRKRAQCHKRAGLGWAGLG